MYTATVDRSQVSKLVRDGFDVAALRQAGGQVQVDLVLSSQELRRVQSRGIEVHVKRNRDGKTATQLAAEQAASGYVVWRSWDEQGGIRDEP
jgi:hypothetical protein